MRHQLTQFVVAEKGWRAAPEVQLLDFLRGVEVTGDQLDFLFQTLQIRLRPPAILGDDLVAGAVVANVRAERHVHVQRQRTLGLAAVAQGMKQVEGADLAVELHGSRIRGVAGPRQVITADQIGVPTNGVEHHAGIPPDWLAVSATLCEGGVGHLDLHQGQNLCCLRGPPSRAGSLPQLECVPLWERACSRRGHRRSSAPSTNADAAPARSRCRTASPATRQPSVRCVCATVR
ncbi:hypothetical protein PS659_06046 [Pseudomonas fluorescens]|uniref:Uncharacterized protein n=1 Tax=Pseudomonas fluorescens TaxID=294 RepID=A0A5E6Y5B3_PSEFL|nr:hypothetical protein PS659_06046 [Pseudomonas fluorescens]